MALQFHPPTGVVIVCDYKTDFKAPEMIKRRPAVVISPPIRARPGLCTIVPISTQIPDPVMPYHVELTALTLPYPWTTGPNWVKADMLFAASFERLDLIRNGKNRAGQRQYFLERLPALDLLRIRQAVLCSIGLSYLTSGVR